MENRDLASLARAQVESFNTNDWDAVRASMLADVVYDERATGRIMQGPEAIIESMKGWKTFNSDVTGTISNIHVSGDTAVVEVTWEGTMDGPLETPGGSVPPTGKSHATHGAWVMTFEGDKLRESRNYFDMLQLLQQVGAM
ncbi:MAG TPA: hypothetical protein DHW54_01775 [Gemmatimonadetes bacterium]|nr:hypothetical protein [Gemmatimonadota bacterium]|tara:strand:- start:787 stop:1209 length:423 start_codon:yes stop_codon:yes gene_type:complete